MIGIVVAMESEARLFGVKRVLPLTPLDLPGGARLILSGMGADAARRGAQKLCDSGVQALASVGVAGALSPQLRSGDLLCPQQLCDDRGAVYRIDAAWRQALHACLEPAQRLQQGALLASARTLATVADKRAAALSSQAVAVDLESAAVAEAAAAAGLPFLALRAISDDVHTRLPAAVLDAVDAYGRPRPFTLAWKLAANPASVLALPALAQGFGRAQASLRTALGRASPGLAWPGATA